MPAKVDEVNREIFRRLGDGRKSFSSIADELGVAENTVRSRVGKLMDEGMLSFQGLVDPDKIPSIQMAYLGMKFSTLDLARKADQMLALKGVVSAAVVTGRYDLIVQLTLSEEEGLSLLDFFRDELTKVAEVLEVESFVVYQSHSLWVPYNM